MKVKVPLLLLLILAAAVGYMLGTESGRAQRDMLLVKLGRKEAEDAEAAEGEAADQTAAAESA